MIKWKLSRESKNGNKLWLGKYGKFSMSIHKYHDQQGLFYEVDTGKTILIKGRLFSEDVELCKKLAESAAKELYGV